MIEVVPAAKVFVPGGLPTYTYNPREELQLERKLRDFLENRHRILSLSGPTKCGKTVLLKQVLGDRGLWISGGSVATVMEFWESVGDRLSVYPTEETSRSAEEGTSKDRTIEGGPSMLKGKRQTGESSSMTEAQSAGRTRPIGLAAKDALVAADKVLVIDDFHYIDPEIQAGIIRGLKDAVFDGLAVVIASVPHRAFDAVRVEREMTGRVEQLPIKFWSREELAGIATKGFSVLNVTDPSMAVNRIAREAFQSPHLMQDFCKGLCRENDITETQAEPTPLRAPDWDPFFRGRASMTSKAAFDLLAVGPRQRTDRKPRKLRDGGKTDIYGAVLRGIAHTGPLTEMSYEQLRRALRDVLDEDPPQRHEVTRVLDEMSEIALKKIEGEPVVDYDAELGKLFIGDPFFAYYLRWAIRTP